MTLRTGQPGFVQATIPLRVHCAGMARAISRPPCIKSKRGDAGDAETRREGRRGVRVELQQANFRLELACAARSNIGAIARHGPHHGAQTSTRTRDIAVRDMAAEAFLVDLNGMAGEDRLVAEPQRAPSGARSAGSRLIRPQCPQTIWRSALMCLS